MSASPDHRGAPLSGASPLLPEDELRLLHDLARVIADAEDLTHSLPLVLERICTALGCDNGASWLVGPDGQLEHGPQWHAEGVAQPTGATGDDARSLARQACAERGVVWGAVAGDGQSRAADSLVAMPVLAAGEPLGALVFHFLAVEERSRAVQVVSVLGSQLGLWLGRKSAQDAVRTSEERLRLLLEHVGDAVFMLSADARVESWTPAAERIFGFTVDDVLGLPAEDFQAVGILDCATFRAELQAARESGRHEVDRWMSRKDGSRFWAHVVTCPVPGSSGNLVGFAQIVRDLTPVRVAEEAARARSRDLERSNRELEEFASIASHDLQEPLRKILAFGDRLQSRFAEDLPEDGRGYLERMQNAAQRMQLLLDDLLAYSRIASRTEPFARVDLNDVAREVVDDLAPRIEEAQAHIELGELPVLEADRAQMSRLLQNLIGNALKFHAPGALPEVRVSSHSVPAGGDEALRWVIEVEDNGIGFDEKYLGRIFGMLQRLHGRSEYEGTGMGLAICRRIAERHDGEITAQSTPGGGARFRVTLPRNQRGDAWQNAALPS